MAPARHADAGESCQHPDPGSSVVVVGSVVLGGSPVVDGAVGASSVAGMSVDPSGSAVGWSVLPDGDCVGV